MTDRSMAPMGRAPTEAGPSTLVSADAPPAIEFVVRPDSVVDGVAVTVIDPASGRSYLVYVNAGLAKLVGYRRDELIGRPLATLLHLGDGPTVPDRHDAIASLERRLRSDDEVEVSLTLRHRAGPGVAVHTTYAPIPSLRSGSLYRIVLVRDLSRRPSDDLLTEHGQLLDQLQQGQDLGSLCHQVASRVEEMLDGTGRCWVGVADPRHRLEAVVTAGQDLDVVGRALRLAMETGDPTSPRCVLVADLPADLRSHLDADGFHALWVFPAVDTAGAGVQRGAVVVAHHSAEVPSDDEIRLLDQLSQVVAGGIERASFQAALVHGTRHDPLTGLPNRALVVDRLHHAMGRIERGRSSLTVVLVDIDHFKSLNDIWGPEVGDRVLVEVANRLLGAVRIGDTVGRISSDQFLMVCLVDGDVDPSVVPRRVSDSLRHTIVAPSGEELRVSASIGVVAVDDVGESPTTIIGNAESALARAVSDGRGRFVLFDKALQVSSRARRDLERALHTAIVEDQLVVHYQPVCRVADGRMMGAEALVRWERPGHGLLGPGEFIPLAEQSGLIVPLGTWIIEAVARDLARWPRATAGWWPVVSVNLSARQLAEESLVAHVVETLRRHRLPAARLGFEVTESMEIDDFKAAHAALDSLSGLGCRIAIDDFGIGHATLDYLRRFSMADVIKVDRSFVAGLGQSREDTAIVSASMALAQSLKLQVVAEGVENRDQLDHLALLGCDYAQGYALGRPVPLPTALAWWRRSVLLPDHPADPEDRPG